MNGPDFDRARQYILTRLERELSPNLFYHGVRHTRNDVLPAVEQLSLLAGIEGEELLLLRTATLYHDAGYIEQYFHNEPIGVRMARETLPDFGYSPGQLEVISGIIMATHPPQAPQTYLQQIMCDADLDSLGRVDFFLISHALRLELMAYGTPTTVRQWYEGQLDFLTAHTYFTAEAKTLRDPGKRQNIEEIRKLLGAC
ncbi:MAG: HD domain-containing protein [Chloroflexota bacterium]